MTTRWRRTVVRSSERYPTQPRPSERRCCVPTHAGAPLRFVTLLVAALLTAAPAQAPLAQAPPTWA